MSLAYALFLRPLPVDDAARVVFADGGFSHPDYLYHREHARAFAEMAGHYSTSPMSVVTPGGPVSVTGAVVTANYFTLLRLTPRAGRFFSVDEDRVPGRDPVAILSYEFWRTRFAEDPRVVGTTVRVNGTAFTVIGIAPEHFHGIVAGLEPNAIWIPTAMFGVGYRYCDGLSRGCRTLSLVGRLAGDTSIDKAHAELAGLSRQLEAEYPETNRRDAASWFARLAGSGRWSRTRNAPIVAMLAGAAGLVLLVASANVAGLLLARGLRRRKEIAVRLAIGASRGRLIRLLLVESVMLAAAGSVAGLQIARLGDGGAASVLRRRCGRFAQPRPVAGPADRADWFRRRPVHRRGDRDRAGTSVHAARYGPCHERGNVRRRPAALDRARRVDRHAGRLVGAAARRGRPARSQLLHAPPRPGLRPGSRGHRPAPAEPRGLHERSRLGLSARRHRAPRSAAGRACCKSGGRSAVARLGPPGHAGAASRRPGRSVAGVSGGHDARRSSVLQDAGRRRRRRARIRRPRRDERSARRRSERDARPPPLAERRGGWQRDNSRAGPR